MLQAAFITLVQEEVGSSWSRDRIREATNRGQNELLAEDCALMRVKPDPFLATTTGIYTYALSSYLYVATTGAQGALVGDIRAVREIYLDYSDLAAIDQLAIDSNFSRATEVSLKPRENRVVLKDWDAMDSLGPNLADCTVKWPSYYNPGTTTVNWRARAYTWPTQLLTESVALSIPEDFQECLLLPHILKSVRRREFGADRDMQEMYKEARARFRLKYSKMQGRGMDMTCQPRPC